jgi:tetratricopeptide (TPR) repeat protein
MGKRSKNAGNSQPASSEPAAQMIEYFAAQLAASRVSDAVDAAQEIMFDAWECEDPRKRINMARKALKTSPDCADAYVLLAEETASTPEQAIDLYAQGVAAGERALGPAAFAEDVGMFWGLLETRPYMRSRLGLALALWDAGRFDEAVSHAESMLGLNPNDNQGVRYVALNWLQQLGRDADADGLLRRYKDDCGTEWAFPAALAAFRRSGDRAAARKALTRAVDANPHVVDFLLGHKKLPKALPAYVVVGR